MSHVVGGNSYRGRKTSLVAGFMFGKSKIKTIATITGALLAFGLAFLSYQYLALALFSLGLSRFYEIAPTVPEICADAVSDAAVAFTGIYDYIGLAVAAIFLMLGLFFAWRSWSHVPLDSH